MRGPGRPDEGVIIKPKYEVGLLAAFPFFGLCILILIGDVLQDPLARPLITSAIVLFTTGLPLVATLLISSIWFGEDAFEVNYYVRPRRVVRYDEVRDLDGQVIRTDQGAISLSSMKNAAEVLEILLSRVAEGQLSGELMEAHSYMPATFVIGLLLWPLLFLALDAVGLSGEWLALATLFAWILSFVASSYGVRAFYRHSADNDSG